MKSIGLHQCIGDEGTYATESVIIGTYVDDMIRIACTEEELDHAERDIEKKVELDKR